MAWGRTTEQRWADAEAILDGRKEPTIGPGRAQDGTFHRRNVLLFVLMLGGVVLISAGALWAVRTNHQQTGGAAGSTSIPQWREILGLVVMVSGIALFAWGFVLRARIGLFGTRWMRAASALTPEQRKQLRRKVTGQDPLDPERLPLVRQAAREVSARRSSVFMFGGVVVVQIGFTISARSIGQAAVSLSVEFMVMVVLTFIAFRDARRAERFLAQHSEADLK